MKRKIIAIGLVSMLTLAMLSGCGKDATPATPDTQATVTETETVTSTSTETIVNEIVETVVEKTDEEQIEEFMKVFYTAVINANGTEEAEELVAQFNSDGDKFFVSNIENIEKTIKSCNARSIKETYVDIEVRVDKNDVSMVEDLNKEMEYYKECIDKGESGGSGKIVAFFNNINNSTGWDEEMLVFTERRKITAMAIEEDGKSGYTWELEAYKCEGHDEWIILSYF